MKSLSTLLYIGGLTDVLLLSLNKLWKSCRLVFSLFPISILYAPIESLRSQRFFKVVSFSANLSSYD